jgi:hypothetical protein
VSPHIATAANGHRKIEDRRTEIQGTVPSWTIPKEHYKVKFFLFSSSKSFFFHSIFAKQAMLNGLLGAFHMNLSENSTALEL